MNLPWVESPFFEKLLQEKNYLRFKKKWPKYTIKMAI